MKLLAYCPYCKIVFQSKLVGDISPSSTVSGCQESCPKCGKMAQTSDYISNIMYVADQAFRTTGDSETLKNLLQILQNGQNQNQDLDQIANKIQILDKKFDDLADCIRQGKKENKGKIVWVCIKELIQFLFSILKQLNN